MKWFLFLLIVISDLRVLAQNNDSALLKSPAPFASSIATDAFYGLNIFTENDFLSPFAPNQDDNYTGGVKINFITNSLRALRLGQTFKKDAWDIVTQNISYGLTVFTPRDLAKPTIITSDRPYASYSFFSIGSSFLKRATSKNIVGYEIFVGKIGSQAGRDLQSKIHREHWFGTQRPVPQGWNNQIANGGAIAVNLRAFTDCNIYETPLNNNFRWLQASWINEVNAGQYLINYAQGLRLNLINVNRVFGKSFPGTPVSPLPTIIANARQTTKEAKKFNFNFYMTPRVRIVAHNATLTGKLLSKPSVYTISPSNINHILVEYDLGFDLKYHFFSTGYNLNGRSKEFKYQQKKVQNWGGFYIAFIYSK